MNLKHHWQAVYQKPDQETSWFQPKPNSSLYLIKKTGLKSVPFIDVGGGSSRLVDHLLAEGWTDLTVLDIAGPALQRSQARLGQKAAQVHWLEQDVFDPLPKSYQIWHDRALFHFLIRPEQKQAYIEQLNRYLKPKAYLIIATFDLDGPEKCSGLPVQRYSIHDLSRALGDHFVLKAHLSEEHRTYSGKIQPFNYVLLQKK